MVSKNSKKIKLSDFPSVNSVLEHDEILSIIKKWSFPFVSTEVKKVANKLKKDAIKNNKTPTLKEFVLEVKNIFLQYESDLIKPVLNGTGVILHTNLGRAPISSVLYDKLKDVVCGYSNLEFDIRDNKRSKRGYLTGKILAALSGAEGGLVVNNNASAVYMIVSNLSKDKEVIVSRGQLVQIGGGFRIPDIIERSGAKLKEVGTTNKTLLNDYKKAINKDTGMVLIVHKSNFIQKGFTEEPESKKIIELAKSKKIPTCFDLGSGLVKTNGSFKMLDEPDIKSAVRTGADLICFSGDKLLGGPQAGLIVGKQKYINNLYKDPLYRVVRPDKLTLGLTESTLLNYLSEKIDMPNWVMASITLDELKSRAEKIINVINRNSITLTEIKSAFGGGSLPEYKFKSYGIKISGDTNKISNELRTHNPPVIARSVSDGIIIDLRTISPDKDNILINAIKLCL